MRTDVPLWRSAAGPSSRSEIDRALLAGEIDVAVHSLKDLSTVLERESRSPRCSSGRIRAMRSSAARRALRLCRPARASARAVCGGGRSSRTRAAIHVLGAARQRADAHRAPRERQVRRDHLAAAGLKRLGLSSTSANTLLRDFPPAVSQGAIGVCVRAEDVEAARWLTPLDDVAPAWPPRRSVRSCVASREDVRCRSVRSRPSPVTLCACTRASVRSMARGP